MLVVQVRGEVNGVRGKLWRWRGFWLESGVPSASSGWTTCALAGCALLRGC